MGFTSDNQREPFEYKETGNETNQSIDPFDALCQSYDKKVMKIQFNNEDQKKNKWHIGATDIDDQNFDEEQQDATGEFIKETK